MRLFWILIAINLVSALYLPYTPDNPRMARITGGVETGTFPFLVSLEYDTMPMCSGVLVSPRIVLTAAHCVLTDSVSDSTLWKAVFRRLDLSKSPEEEGAIVKDVQVVYVHDKFDNQTLAYDIAAFHLDTPITFNDDVKPALPDFNGDFSTVGTLVSAVGWGSKYNSTLGRLEISNTPNVAKMPILDISVCKSYYQFYSTVFSDIMQCIGVDPSINSTEIKGTCNGDSGGPVFTTDANGNFVLVGIISWGLPNSCGLNGDPSVNTAISHSSDWIRTVFRQVGETDPQLPIKQLPKKPDISQENSNATGIDFPTYNSQVTSHSNSASTHFNSVYLWSLLLCIMY